MIKKDLRYTVRDDLKLAKVVLECITRGVEVLVTPRWNSDTTCNHSIAIEQCDEGVMLQFLNDGTDDCWLLD